jgi:hypothetical protein
MILRINKDYFLIKINQFFYEMKCGVLFEVGTEFLNII